jgi:hypothetical protein
MCAQVVLELLRQLLVDGGYYGTVKGTSDLNMLVEMQYVCEMSYSSVSARRIFAGIELIQMPRACAARVASLSVRSW